MSASFAILTPSQTGGYTVLATCTHERNALKLARRVARVLKSNSRVYTQERRQIYCGELKRWVSVETALVADGQLEQVISSFSTHRLESGLNKIAGAIN